MIADALEHPCAVPSKERRPLGALRRAPLLAAQVEIGVEAADAETVRPAAAELSAISETFRSRALGAAAALARGRVALADGDADLAVRECEVSLAGWSEVGAPYEAAVARLVLAQGERLAGRTERAQREERAALAVADRIGAQVLTRQAFSAPPPPRAAACVFRREGDLRTVDFAGRTVVLRDLKGMRYLARLLEAPDREFHVLDLVAGETGEGLAEIDDDLDDAAARGDGERLALARADRKYLVRELAAAFGLGGRYRVAGSTSERARASVTRSLRYAVSRIAEHHPAMADHLERTVRTGTYCSYVPDLRLPASWEI